MSLTLGFPQIIMCILIISSITDSIIKHGKETTSKCNWIQTLIAKLILIWILQAGGFFG